MDTKDTVEATAPSVAPAKQTPRSKTAGEPEPEDPVLPVPLGGLEENSLRSPGAAFSELQVQTPGDQAKVKESRGRWSRRRP